MPLWSNALPMGIIKIEVEGDCVTKDQVYEDVNLSVVDDHYIQMRNEGLSCREEMNRLFSWQK